ncbi:MAG: Dihydrofolate synthase/folylpolyglutamate synthase [Nitrosomonadaceae bacterium]|jgi:dihydrofolate synthase/folylpolyglutamate synthase|nr:bifunctional tetrahydrofolate synthase/dihydrofolate synthase [Nitrosospira sp.]MBI0413397.1 bifunctional tetrahydrofolate synthase/dihydrofolate synthase [Nitrosospira sp.]MCG3771518.1 Dihydrofolate synthase/folylpolyglutamate synthase [Nitrosomonadaceae bacterium]MDW7619428.1 bifunctional tetrahydrofolate synthase/dihydrofolate synthase [Nitrosomonadaceae bacterium]GDX59258.1 bifunctional folylpolyglutamate synthase/dihydrofolate synthase [Nitrosomonadaceae bacterium]
MLESNVATRTLTEWLFYLEQLHPITIEMGLDRVDQVKDRLGLAPDFPIITVGGTNGKGSTCAMMESILSCAGYRVGCYTSPHLLRYNERVRISRYEARDEDLCKAFEEVELARVGSAISLTYFEFGTLAAMQLFKQSGVDVVILEVGLGGRLDAVNIFEPDCSVLTSIDLDHMDYLGSTREEIGFEKAGIFRGGKAAICSEAEMPASILRQAELIGADLMHIDSEFGYSVQDNQWSYWGPGGNRHALPHPALRGSYQLRNACTCLAALDVVRERLPTNMGDIRQGLLQVELPGRFQILPGLPVTILDVAHNPAAARTLATSLGSMGQYHKTFAIFAMLKDKDIPGVVTALKSVVDVWLVAGIDVSRGASADDLRQVLVSEGIVENGVMVIDFPDIGSAYAYACERASENDRICVFGSFYTVSGVLRYRDAVKHRQQ